MRIHRWFPPLALALSWGCGGGGGGAAPAPASTTPSVPTALTSTGTLGNIHLSWSASTGGGLTGYNIFRSTDGSAWTQLNGAPVASNGYDDAIASPAGDGVIYQYRVTAVGAQESAPSAAVRNLHGTRLPAVSAAGFTTMAAQSPYVAEGTVEVNGGHLLVDTGTKLYVAEGASVDVEHGDGSSRGRLAVKGLLRVLATPGAPATFTAHKVGGVLNANEGFALWFEGAVDFNPADGSGTLLQNTRITNLASGVFNGGIHVFNCSPKLSNLNVTANAPTGTSYLELLTGAGPIIQNCAFTKVVPSIHADLRGTSFQMDHNRFRGGYYALAFFNVPNPAVSLSQIDANDFDGTKPAYLYNIGGSTDVPVGNNFWSNGSGTPPLPTELYGLTSAHFDFSPPLPSVPTGVGPTWLP